MSNSYRLRQLAFGLLIALFAFTLSSSASAQTQNFKRKVVLEEFTGTWCQYCPIGAWVMDSIQHRMGDWVVELAWHNGGGDPMQIPPGAQLADKDFGIQSYPTILGDRLFAFPNYNWTPTVPTYTWSVNEAKSEPDADIRITNVTIVDNKIDFDVEVSPLLPLSQMPKEDTAKYTLFVAVTEDDVLADQTWFNPETQAAEIIADFSHQNVVRAVRTNQMGDQFPMGTTTAVNNYPIKKHYSVTSINGEWNQAKLRLKAFVSKRYQSNKYQYVMNADQTAYVGTLPETAPNAVWTVTPAPGSEIQGDQQAMIIWSKQGSTTKVKLEYSIDGGAKWEPIATDITSSPYSWTIPQSAQGQNVIIRITDATTASITSTSEPFMVIAPIPVTAEVLQPTAGEKLRPGSKYMIEFTTTGEFGTSAKLEYSTDGGSQWINITTITNGSTSYNWTVPNVDAPAAQIRVSNAAGTVSGLSGTFSIAPLGTINAIVVNGGNPVLRNTPIEITWTSTGDIGSTLKLEWSNGGTQWSIVQNNMPSTTTSYWWTTPDQHVASAYLRLTSNENVTLKSAAFEIGNASSVKLVGTPTSNGIASSYPNPFASASTIVYHVATAGDVTLKVSDILGKDIMTLESGAHQPGVYSTELDASTLVPGTYVVTLLINGETYSRTVSVTK
jgi:hypothetical protein